MKLLIRAMYHHPVPQYRRWNQTQIRDYLIMRMIRLLSLIGLVVLSGCASIKYGTYEKFGVHKRDILVSDVKDARDAQKDAQEQFKDALERFGSVVRIEETSLKKAYDRLNDEYEDSVDAAEDVSEEIDEVEDVASALFSEWRDEIKQYTDPQLRRGSENQYADTEARYKQMIKSMRSAEATMQPVLATLKDNVLYLKHNLNAQAVGSLQGTFDTLETDVDVLIERMNLSIKRSDEFIASMGS